MIKATFHDLSECTEFCQALRARPPALTHGAALFLSLLLVAAFLWAALTQADLVVRAAGRIRPITSPERVVMAARGEVLSASVGGRVVEVHFHEGDEVHRGDVLLRLDTAQLDNDIAKRKRALQADEDELSKLGHLHHLASLQHHAARAKAEAELSQTETELRTAKRRQAAEVQLARRRLDDAQREQTRLERLAAVRAVAPVEAIAARLKTDEARAELIKAKLPVDEEKVEIMRRALGVVDKDHEAKKKELQIKQTAKEKDLASARVELANLQLEREHASLRAPIDGIVTLGDIKVGDHLESGRVVGEIAARDGFRFEAKVPSEEVGHLEVGMPANIKLDAYDYQKYGTVPGTVDYLSPDSGAEGQGVVYTVEIRVDTEVLGRGEHQGRVKLGMAGIAEIVTRRESVLMLLVKRIRQSVSLG